jgi:SAM-dependent methyltransferase
MSNYDTFAPFYDSVFGDRKEVALLLEKLLRRHNPKARHILEMGCGSGSMMKFLSRRFALTGVDSSAGMIAQARKKVPNATSLVADITDFDLGKTFDAVICPFDTINHVTDFVAWKKVFRNAHKHLAPDGVFIFDVNTEPKMERYRLEPAAADLTRDKIAIVDVTREKRFHYLVQLKLLERVRGETFRHHELNIPEIVVPAPRIMRELTKLFGKVSTVDPERGRPTAKTEELFFVCTKPKRIT